MDTALFEGSKLSLFQSDPMYVCVYTHTHGDKIGKITKTSKVKSKYTQNQWIQRAVQADG